jgi:hypothetical protein
MLQAERSALIRRGFEIAREFAEVSEDDGYRRTNPYIDWTKADRALGEALAAEKDRAP